MRHTLKWVNPKEEIEEFSHGHTAAFLYEDLVCSKCGKTVVKKQYISAYNCDKDGLRRRHELEHNIDELFRLLEGFKRQNA